MEYVEEAFLNPFLSYPNIKNLYPTQVIDFRYQADHITPQKIQLFEEYRNDPATARVFVVVIGQRQLEMKSDGNKLTEIKLYGSEYSLDSNPTKNDNT